MAKKKKNNQFNSFFQSFNLNDLFSDITTFNKKFSVYLEFYNTKRVHHAFKNKYSPIQFMLRSDHYKVNLPKECKNGWTYTKNRQKQINMVE